MAITSPVRRCPARPARPTTIPAAALPSVVALLGDATAQALQATGASRQIAAIWTTPRSITVTLDRPIDDRHGRAIRDALRARISTARMVAPQTIRIPLPLAEAPAVAPAAPYLPVLRWRAARCWWPLRPDVPLIFAGDALPALRAAVAHLPAQPGLLLYDPEHSLRVEGDRRARTTAALPAHQASALEQARTHALRCAYHRLHTPDAPALPLLTLIVVAPDAAAWRELTPLLHAGDGGVCVIIALTTGATSADAQDACRHGHVVEIGARGCEPLPEACRPAGLDAPRWGMALAWQTPRLHWRGAPVHPD